MAIKARWGAAELVVPDEDPFLARVEDVGFPIELGADEPRLNQRLVELVGQESALFNAGVTCPVKDRPDSTCHACPMSAHEDTTSAMQPLCSCGREQEIVQTELVVARAARGAAN